MAQVHATAERVVDAPPSEVFMFLSDYKNRRPTILPDNYKNYRVDAGGVGAGTDVEYVLHAGKRERPYYLHVEAPEPGRRLIERDTRSSLVNTWTVSRPTMASAAACGWPLNGVAHPAWAASSSAPSHRWACDASTPTCSVGWPPRWNQRRAGRSVLAAVNGRRTPRDAG